MSVIVSLSSLGENITEPPRFVKRIVLCMGYGVQVGFEPTCNASSFSIASFVPKTPHKGASVNHGRIT